MYLSKITSSESALCFLLKAFLFLFPWQTIWIYREVFINGVKMEYATLGFYATEILLWVIVSLFIIWYWRRFKSLQIKNYKLKITKDRVFILACLSLISYLFISITWSVDKALALQQSLHVLEAILLFLVLLLGPLKSSEGVKWLALGAVLPAMLGIWQFFSQSAFAFKWLGLAEHVASNPGTSVVVGDEIGRWLRAYGPFAHPNVLGGYMVIILALMLVAHAKCERLRKCEKIGSSIICSLLIISIFLSVSRSALLALAVIILFYCFVILWRKQYSSHITFHISHIIVVSIILSTLLFPALKVRVLTSSSYEVASVVERAQGFDESWGIFKDNLWLGVGAGNYTAYLQKIDPTREPWEYQPAHNVALLFAAESGVVGIALFLSVIIFFITYHVSRITYQRLRTGGYQCVMCYVLCVTCYATLAFFDHYLISSYTGLILTGVFWGLAFRSAFPLGKVVPNSSTVHSKQLNLSQDF